MSDETNCYSVGQPTTADIGFYDNVLKTALGLYDAGITPIPLSRNVKQPPAGFEYTQWQHIKPGRDLVTQWFTKHTGNVGVLTGAVSNNLVIVDFDKLTAFVEFEFNTYPELTNTLSIRTRDGVHYYYYVDDLPQSSYNIGKVIDVKSTGYCVCPPSTVEGFNYAVLKNNPVKRIKTLNYLCLERFETHKTESTHTTHNVGGSRRDTLKHRRIDAIKAKMTILDAFPRDYEFEHGALNRLNRTDKPYISVHCPSPDHTNGDIHPSGQYFYKDEKYYCNTAGCRFNRRHQFDCIDVYRRLNELALDDAIDELMQFYGITVEE